MESLKNYTLNLKELGKKALVTAGLASVLTFWATSCSKTTPEDVINMQQKVEMIGWELHSLIQSRKAAVIKYNETFSDDKRPETNGYSFDLLKADAYKEIVKTSKEIEDLARKKIKAERNLGKMESKCLSTNPWSLNPNEYDYLLNF